MRAYIVCARKMVQRPWALLEYTAAGARNRHLVRVMSRLESDRIVGAQLKASTLRESYGLHPGDELIAQTAALSRSLARSLKRAAGAASMAFLLRNERACTSIGRTTRCPHVRRVDAYVYNFSM